jgi:tail protein
VIPEQPGAVVQSIRHDVREFDLPLYAATTSYDALQVLLTEMAYDMDPVAGEGILRRISKSNALSDLFCRCVSGTGIEGEGANGPIAHKPTLIFQAYDPYWYREPVALRFVVGGQTGWFPMLPVHLGASAVIGDVQVENTGHVESWPTWTITGPGTDVTLTNNTTNETIAILRELSAGQQVVIDTYTGQVTGANWRRYLTRRVMWALQPGMNDLTLTMNNSTPSSTIDMVYRPRTLAP